MQSHATKSTDNSATERSQPHTSFGLTLTPPEIAFSASADHRPETRNQRALQKLANTSPHVQDLAHVQEMIDASPHMVAQRKGLEGRVRGATQGNENRTGLADTLKSGIESLSGIAMDDIKVHYNSSQPPQLNALAYTQGTDIYVAPGQVRHLPHEAWHVVQQKQGRVKPTMQMKGNVHVNDDTVLEEEADVMGAKAVVQRKPIASSNNSTAGSTSSEIVQRVEINKHNVTDEVLRVYRSLNPVIKAYIHYTASMDEFFELSSEEQIDFLKVLQKSLPILDMIIEQQGAMKAIAGPQDPQHQQLPDLMQLRIAFFQLNPDFITQSLRLFRNQSAAFRFYNPQGIVTIGIASLAALQESSPAKMIEGPEKPDIPSIGQVMAHISLKGFMEAQHLFQLELGQMDGLDSSGLEFEFASFALPGGGYQKEEIIPSHQTMAKTRVFGRRFGLAWKLESDSFNTLELVTPPFVYPRNEHGSTKRQAIKQAIEQQTSTIADELQTEAGTLPAAAAKLTAAGLGTGWQVGDRYRAFVVVKNQKSGGSVYSQENVSMFPDEIGAMLEDKFKQQGQFIPHILEPIGLALQIRQSLNEQLQRLLVKTTDGVAVKNAIAVFARYASNAISIPSMRHRQETGARKDTLPTQVKETLGIWVKTDALNLLQPILAKPEDLQLFTEALEKGKAHVLKHFTDVSNQMIQQATPPPTMAQPKPNIDQGQLKQLFLLLKQQNPDMKATDIMDMARQQLAPAQPQGPNPVAKMKEYTLLMMKEVVAFIDRALQVGQHQETAPTSTTKEFLDEKYGTGEGVRKGTYLKGVSTSKGNMYVTEIR